MIFKEFDHIKGGELVYFGTNTGAEYKIIGKRKNYYYLVEWNGSHFYENRLSLFGNTKTLPVDELYIDLLSIDNEKVYLLDLNNCFHFSFKGGVKFMNYDQLESILDYKLRK